MTENLTISDNPHKCSNTAEEFKLYSGRDLLPLYEEITVMKTEIKEELYDFEMPADDMVCENVKEEYISSPENNFEKVNLKLTKSTEQLLDENVDFGNYQSEDVDLQENKFKYELYHSNFDTEILAKTGVHCSDCKYVTNIKRDLARHPCICTKEKPFKCTYKNCDCEPEQKELCECSTCRYAATTKALLKRHILAKHSAEPKKYNCIFCNYIAYTEVNLVQHILTHTQEKRFKCTQKNCKCAPGQKELCMCNTCEYAATTTTRLNRHVLARHSVEPKKYQCENCMYATHRKETLMQHMLTHTNDKPFKCTYKNCECTSEQKELCECNTCEYAARSKSLLKRHVLARHSTEPKKHKCKDCNYAAHLKAHLIQHIRTHR